MVDEPTVQLMFRNFSQPNVTSNVKSKLDPLSQILQRGRKACPTGGYAG